MSTEKEVEAYLVRVAKSNKCLTYKWSSPNNRGVPDRIIVPPFASPIFVEVKRLNGRLSALQIHELDRLATAGQTCYVVRSKDDVDCLFAGTLPAWRPTEAQPA